MGRRATGSVSGFSLHWVVRARLGPHRFGVCVDFQAYSHMSRNGELCGRRVLPMDFLWFATSFQFVQQIQFCLSPTWICPSCKFLTDFISTVFACIVKTLRGVYSVSNNCREKSSYNISPAQSQSLHYYIVHS